MRVAPVQNAQCGLINRRVMRTPPCRATVASAPAAVSSSHHVWDEVEMLKQQLRDAEAERDRYESLLSQNELGSQHLMSKVRHLAMNQAKAKMALQELKSVHHQAKELSAAEHLALFADRIHVAGKAFKNEACKQNFIARQHLGMQRLVHYESTIVSMTESLRSAVRVPATQQVSNRGGLNSKNQGASAHN